MPQIGHHECRHMQRVSATERLYVYCCPCSLLQISTPTKPSAVITTYSDNNRTRSAVNKRTSVMYENHRESTSPILHWLTLKKVALPSFQNSVPTFSRHNINSPGNLTYMKTVMKTSNFASP